MDDIHGDEFEAEPALDAGSERLAELSDAELEAELTIAGSVRGLEKRYEAILAERERRRARFADNPDESG
jgi:hypothetical protein